MPMPSNNFKPFLAYLTPTDYSRLKKFSSKNKMTMTQIVREAINVRISGGNSYIKGFNDGIEDAIKTIEGMQYSQMRFPSGKSIAELIADDLTTRIMKEGQDEAGITAQPVSGV